MKPSFKLNLIALGCAFSVQIFSEIIIDGELNEQDWNTARQFTQFYEVYPYSLDEVNDNKTIILVQQSEKGIYIGYKNFQPNEKMRSQNHERDDERSMADKNGVTIDFDADGLMSYQFFVSSGGSIGDATYVNENDKSTDWDGDWRSATTIADGVWFSEIFIPWTIAPMKQQSGEQRNMRIAFYRMMAADSRVIATIKGSPYQNVYMSAFDDITFNNYKSTKLDLFPYLTLNDDVVLGDTDTKTGTEVFWKIDSSKQLNATINPDFGQVESDEVVVNFSATETFYSDKRPFFSENQSLFNVKGYMFRIINTRRIGSAPDYDCSIYDTNEKDFCLNNKRSSNDIDAAFRYTQQAVDFDFGFMGAFEADEKHSEGKDFYALRLRTKKDNLSLGYLATHVERPVIDRAASVHSIDFEYRPSSTHRWSGILMNSDINGEKGYGLRVGYGYDPDQTFHSGLGVYYFDKDLNINDMGYLTRNNWFNVSGRTQFKQTNFPSGSIFRARLYEIGYGYKTDANFNKEPNNIAFKIESSFTNTSEFKTEVFYRASGRDNRITRNSILAPFIEMPEGYGLQMDFTSPYNDAYGYVLKIDRRKGSEYSPALNWENQYSAMLKLTPRDNLAFSFMYKESEEKDWLNWLQDNLLGTYKRNQRTSVLGFQWFDGTKHELRVRAQMVAFTARDPKALKANLRGKLEPLNSNLDPITLSEVAFQIRYRYEFMPLAYLYVVYTKGGRVVFEEEEDDLAKLYRKPWNDPQNENFTVKLRYRF